MNSKHYNVDRQAREAIIRTIEGTEKRTYVKIVRIDRGHRNGAELHKITNKAIIEIYNERTGRLCTKLIARPGQIKRYYKENEVVPKNLLKLAREYTTKGYNEI